MVEYLRKFANLQALTVHENPFCKDDSSQQQTDPTKNYQYPGSYETILAILDKLKYLDYRPIDPDQKKQATEHYRTQNQKERSDNQHKLDEEKEKNLIKMTADLKHANAEAVLDFFRSIDQKITEDTNRERLRKLPQFEQKMKDFEKQIEENLNSFKKDIIEEQEKKDLIIKAYEEKFEFKQDKYVEECKLLVDDFKKKFKKYCANIPGGKGDEDILNEIGLKILKDKLYEIEANLKFTNGDNFTKFEKLVRERNSHMTDRTERLRNELSSYKDTLKKQMLGLKEELQHKCEEGIDVSDSIIEVNRKFKYKFFKFFVKKFFNF